MKYFTRIAVLFHVTLTLFVCCFLTFFALQFLSLTDVESFLTIAYTDASLKNIILSIAGLMFLMNFVFFKMFFVSNYGDKIIAFDNPAGRVSVSLVALEEMIKRKVMQMPEIKDVKVSLSASKKGLYVKVRLILSSEVNIPEITSKVQDKITRKVQNTIGIEEQVNVAIYVGKIVPEKMKEKRQIIQQEEEKKEVNVPFEGYRA
ncbi:MAG: alkaline shock response membrane anchor protein AmaP [Candidatus Omnitrophica bacterium]|nr:alkaline shock response membrane anchor protein AmaP [Candidatus Omnitrophota bacterium]MBU1997042.1 alkaline shock response membrane anchor protein AmaP [Candidatus Omnitrophota bacterium]MBU4334569.1 alkaline shock response membrane anchor protein AmaP [Candidatus Omnitrophota bacterium]